MQPLNRRFCCRPQKPRKALCGRRCRPLCTAEGQQRNPSAFTCLFSYRLPTSAQKGAKTVPNGSLPLQGLCLPVVRLYLATRGDTGADTAVTSASPELRLRHRFPHRSYRRDPPYRQPMHSARFMDSSRLSKVCLNAPASSSRFSGNTTQQSVYAFSICSFKAQLQSNME